MKEKWSLREVLVVGLFLLSVAFYFFGVGGELFPRGVFAMRLALPAAVLTLGGIGLIPGLVSLGFAFCTIGDAFGVLKSFEGQMGGFAVAQICFIAQFIKDIRQSVKSGSRRKLQPALPIIATLVCLFPLIFAARNILPEVRPLPIRIGCIVYALLLLSSAWTAMVRSCLLKNYFAMAGCLIFLVSDLTLAWNKFTAPIPRAGLYILSTYYAALILIFLGTRRRNQVKLG